MGILVVVHGGRTLKWPKSELWLEYTWHLMPGDMATILCCCWGSAIHAFVQWFRSLCALLIVALWWRLNAISSADLFCCLPGRWHLNHARAVTAVACRLSMLAGKCVYINWYFCDEHRFSQPNWKRIGDTYMRTHTPVTHTATVNTPITHCYTMFTLYVVAAYAQCEIIKIHCMLKTAYHRNVRDIVDIHD